MSLLERRCWEWAAWIVPAFLYVALIVMGVYVCRDAINPDAVCYIRRALYLSHGDIAHSISGYWSPLFSWCLCPLMYFHVPGLLAARIVLATWGLAYVLIFHLFLKRFLGIHPVWRLPAVLIVAILAVRLALVVISPDLAMAGLLLLYLTIVSDERLLHRRRLPMAAGLIGGVAYLAKAFVFPYFLVHFPATVIYRCIVKRQSGAASIPRPTMRRAIATALIGCASFAMPAVPWICGLHGQYQRWMFSTAGPMNHANMAPRGFKRGGPPLFGAVPDPFIIRNEITDWGEHPDWSPFHSGAYFKHQLKIIGGNANLILAAIGASAGIFVGDLVLGVAALLGLLYGWSRLGDAVCRRGGAAGPPSRLAAVFAPAVTDIHKIIWLWLTAMLYTAPFLLVFYESRYTDCILIPLSIMLAMGLCATVGRLCGAKARDVSGEPRRQAWPGSTSIVGCLIVPLVILAAFAYAQRKQTIHHIVHTRPSVYPEIARKLADIGLCGRLASTDRVCGLFVAFLVDGKFVYFPKVQLSGELKLSSAEVERQLAEVDARTLLIWDDPLALSAKDGANYDNVQVANAIVQHGWDQRGCVALPSGDVRIYTRRMP